MEASQVSDQNPIDSVDSESQQETREDKVSYESYKKAVETEKKAKAERDALRLKVQEYEQKDLEAKGNFQAVIENLRGQLKESDEKLKKTETSYQWRTVNEQIKAHASGAGCISPDKLLKLMEEKDFGSLQFDPDNLTLNSQDVTLLMDKLKKENPFLFNVKGNPRIDNAIPNNAAPVKDYKQMSLSDLKNAYKKSLMK